jgi:hypothetical protein
MASRRAICFSVSLVCPGSLKYMFERYKIIWKQNRMNLVGCSTSDELVAEGSLVGWRGLVLNTDVKEIVTHCKGEHLRHCSRHCTDRTAA